MPSASLLCIHFTTLHFKTTLKKHKSTQPVPAVHRLTLTETPKLPTLPVPKIKRQLEAESGECDRRVAVERFRQSAWLNRAHHFDTKTSLNGPHVICCTMQAKNFDCYFITAMRAVL